MPEIGGSAQLPEQTHVQSGVSNAAKPLAAQGDAPKGLDGRVTAQGHSPTTSIVAAPLAAAAVLKAGAPTSLTGHTVQRPKTKEEMIAFKDEMKVKLEKCWHSGMCSGVEKTKSATNHLVSDHINLDKAEGKQVAEGKVERQIWRTLKSVGLHLKINPAVRSVVKAAAKEVVDNYEQEKPVNEGILKDVFDKIASGLEGEITKDELAQLQAKGVAGLKAVMNREFISPSKVEAETQKLAKAVSELKTLLTISVPKDSMYQARNRKILKKIEEAIKTPAYQMLREYPQVEEVAFLQEMCRKVHLEISGMEEYRQLGREFSHQLAVTFSPGKSSEPSVGGAPAELKWGDFASDVETTQQKALNFYTDKEGNAAWKKIPRLIVYAFKNPTAALGSFASEHPSFIRAGILSEYDALKLGNHPLTIGDLECPDGRGVIRSLYAPSPTAGAQIRPLVYGFIDCLENQAFSKAGTADKPICGMMVDINYQTTSRSKSQERTSTKSIMKLADDYPHVVDAMTLPMDTSFYEGKPPKKPGIIARIKAFLGIKELETLYNGAEDFHKTFTKHMFGIDPPGDAHRKIVDKNDNGYVFSKNIKDSEITSVLGATKEMYAALETHEGRATEEGKNWAKLSFQDKAMTYQTTFHTLMRVDVESRRLKELPPERRMALVVGHCKQMVDRGNVMNAIYSLAMNGAVGAKQSVQEMSETLLGALQGRALSVDDRVILRHRLSILDSFLKGAPQKAMTEAVRKLHQWGEDNTAAFKFNITAAQVEIQPAAPLLGSGFEGTL